MKYVRHKVNPWACAYTVEDVIKLHFGETIAVDAEYFTACWDEITEEEYSICAMSGYETSLYKIVQGYVQYCFSTAFNQTSLSRKLWQPKEVKEDD